MESKFFFVFMLIVLVSGCRESGTQYEKGTESDRPDSSRFTWEVLVNGLDEPFQVEFDEKGHVYWIERKGFVKRINENSGVVEIIGKLPLAKGSAPGLIGFLLDKDFEHTRQLYLYYSAAEDNGEIIRLSRFMLNNDNKIDMDSEVVLLRVPWEYPDSSHFGGGMAWDGEGNLYLSIGGDTQASQYAPLAFTNSGGRGEDAARSAGNTNDIRGSILRIHPKPDGTFAIPEGNLFPEGTPKTRPEIFVMGNRNPWRLSIDSETGYLHWGEVGPDAGVSSEQFGPIGFDEFNVAKEAGNFGWPFVVGKNQAYNSYDYASGTYNSPHDPEGPINDSPNNTGLQKLPPAKPALIAYPYKVSEEWPVLGSSGRSAVGGPIFRKADFGMDAPRVFPAFYEGKWLVTDYVRNWIMVISMNEERTEVLSIEPLVPLDQLFHKQPLDMDFGPSGDLYLIEYGSDNQGRLSKISYNGGNRAPIAHALADQLTGIVPLEVRLSHNSKDFDGDDLDFSWAIIPVDGGKAKNYKQKNPVVKFEQPGKYYAVLTVSDPSGASNKDTLKILAGNERPKVDFDIVNGNRSFYFPDETIAYRVLVSDQEDGNSQENDISPDKISVTAEYIPSGMTLKQLSTYQTQGKILPDVAVRHLQAQSLIAENNCIACHKNDVVLIGPSFRDIARRYKDNTTVFETLSSSIIGGSTGKWKKATIMPPNPMLTKSELVPIINYILDLSSPEDVKKSIPIAGEFKTKAYNPSATNGGRLDRFYALPFEMGSYLLHASYTDEGNSEVEGLELAGNDIILLRYPLLPPEAADVLPNEGISYTPSTDDPGFIFTGQGSYIGFENIDLTGINTIKIGAITRFWHWSHFIGATIELRLGSPTGELISEPYRLIPAKTEEGDGPFFDDDWEEPISVDVSEVNGTHDVYIVVHNSEAKDSDALFILTGVGFEQ